MDNTMPSLLDLLDSVSQTIDDDAVKEMLAEKWMKEYRKLEVMEERSDKEWKRLAELHDKLSDYRLSDPLKFDKKFLSNNDRGDAEDEQGTSPDNPNTYDDLEELSPKSSNILYKECNNDSERTSRTSRTRSANLTGFIRMELKDATEPDGVPVAWYSSSWKKNYQRRIYYIGPSDYEIGKAKEWVLSELENLPEVTGSKETILDITTKSGPVQYQYGFSNIEKVVAVVAPYSEKASCESRPRELLTRPTYVLVKWKDILPQNLNHSSLMGDCESFILKSKLLGAVSKTNRVTLRGWIEDFRGQNEVGNLKRRG